MPLMDGILNIFLFLISAQRIVHLKSQVVDFSMGFCITSGATEALYKNKSTIAGVEYTLITAGHLI